MTEHVKVGDRIIAIKNFTITGTWKRKMHSYSKINVKYGTVLTIRRISVGNTFFWVEEIVGTFPPENFEKIEDFILHRLAGKNMG